MIEVPSASVSVSTSTRWLEQIGKWVMSPHSRTGESSRHDSPRVASLATRLPRLVSRWYPDILWNRTQPVRALTGGRAATPTDRVDERTLYLTFDDGPTDAGTPRLLETLARFAVPATFFVVGEQVTRWPGRVREMRALGHTLGNHTFSHADAWRMPFARVREELLRTTGQLAELTGERPRWIRPPHGHFTTKMRRFAAAQGQHLAMWDVLPADYASWATETSIERFVLRWVRPGAVVVLHDSHATGSKTAIALSRLLPRLLAAGWTFRRL